MTRKLSTFWIPALIVMVVIFLLSSQSYEQQSIKKQLTFALHRTSFLSEHLSQMEIQYGTLRIDGTKVGPGAVLEFILRKLAHVTEYFLLSICLLRAIRFTTKMRIAYAAIITIVVSVGFAITDEYHQLFSINRGSRPQDVVLDAAGALIGILVYGSLARWKKRRLNRSYTMEGL